MDYRRKASLADVVGLRPVPVLHARCTVGEAARQIYMSGCDALIVADEEDDTILGVITSRDVVAVIAQSLDPEEVTLAQRLHPPAYRGGYQPLSEVWFG